MKKFMFLLFSLLFLVPLAALGQEIEPPEDIIDVITNLDIYLASLLGLSILTNGLTAIFIRWFKITKDWGRRILSWGLPMIIAFVFGYLLKMGFLAEETWYIVLAYGLGAGLVANGIFTIEVVKAFLQWLAGIIKK